MRWKGGRVVDGTGLENQQVNSLAGSNPVPSAIRNAILAFFYARFLSGFFVCIYYSSFWEIFGV